MRRRMPRARGAKADDFAEILKPRPGDWPTYHGRLDGNRHSALAQITTANVRNLSLQWIHSVRGFDNEMTPLVLDGIMYITATNQVSAIDATTGREIWRFSRPRSTGAARRRGDWFQSRRCGARFAGLSRDRQRASRRGEPGEWRAALGSRAAGKHAAALRRHDGAARGRRSRHRRRVGRR